MNGLPWPPADGPALILLVALAALFALFHYRFSAEVLAPRFGEGPDAQAAAVHAQRMAGVVLLGLVPAGLVAALRPRSAAALGLGLPDPAAAGWGLLIICGLALPAVVMATRKPDFVEHYPQIRARGWSGGRYVANAATWGAYLVAYEFFFRGVMLFTLVEWVDPWIAIGITTIAYVYAHLPKPGQETAGTVPMGVVFAAVAVWSGSIWAPVLGHWIIANTSDVLAARRRP